MQGYAALCRAVQGYMQRKAMQARPTHGGYQMTVHGLRLATLTAVEDSLPREGP